jgi:hypothetical protein
VAKWANHPDQLDIFGALKKLKNAEYQRAYASRNRAAYNERARTWRLNNPTARRATELKYKYKVGDFAVILAVQDGVCAICKEIPKPNRRNTRGDPGWVVDHCHDSGRVRGVLCARCNNMLAFAKDTTEMLAAGIAYLNDPPAHNT